MSREKSARMSSVGILRRCLCLSACMMLAWSGLSLLGSSNPAQAAPAPSVTTLPGSYSSMAVDPVNDHVFVSTPGSGSVEVLDFSGTLVDTITGFSVSPSPYANSIIYADGSIYMTDTTNGTVDQIDPSTLSVTVLDTGFVSPFDLVYAAGTLWTTSGGSWPPPTLVGVDIANGVATSYPQLLQGFGLVSGGSGSPDTIFSYDPGDSPMTINRIDVTSTPVAGVSVDQDGLSNTMQIDNVNDVAISPDGSFLIPAGGAPYEFDELTTSNLQNSGTTYSAVPYPSAIAITSANGGLVAGGLDGLEGPDLIVYPLGDPSEQILTSNGSGEDDEVVPRGLSFSPDGESLFEVTHSLTGDTGFEFQVVDLPNEMQPTRFSIAVDNSPSAAINWGGGASLSEVGLPSTATGVVSFSANGSGLCVINLTGQSDESTSCVTSSSLDVGSYPVTATFTDTDWDFQNSDSTNSVTLTIEPAPPPVPPSPGPSTPTAPSTPTPLSTPTAPSTPTPPSSPTAPSTVPPGSPSPASTTAEGGYDLVGSDGGVFVFNPLGVSGGFYGSLPGMGIDVNDIVGMVPTANDEGYYLVGSDGGVFAFGNAPFYGSLPGQDVHVHDIVGIIPTSGDTGYYLVGSDGGIFAFGSAQYLGSLPAQNIHVDNVVGIAATPNGRGYWVVTSTGHVYNFGSASAYGSANAPVTAIAASPDGDGYWLVGPDGGIFTFGASSFYGSLPGQAIDVDDIVGIVPSADGKGYLLFGSDGGIFTFGDAGFEGSLPGISTHVHDIVGAVPTS